MLLKVFQLAGARLPVHCTWNKSLLGANHVSRNPNLPAMFVPVRLLIVKLPMDGTGFTITAKLFVALKGGTPLSVTMVVMTLVVPACASVGVQVITPVFVLMVGTFVPVTVLDKA